MSRPIYLALMLALAAPAWAGTDSLAPDPKGLATVTAFLASGDCPGAVGAIKEGIKSRHPAVLLVAGTMFEEGVCVKPDWDKAVNLYLLADAAGNRSAIPRLAAGYAVAGREHGLALWWAAHRPLNLPAACVPAADPEKQQDAFNAALERMPPALFQACVYIAGVTYDVMANVEFPPDAARYRMSGTLAMEFIPAEGAINWRYLRRGDVERPSGVRDMGKEQFEEHRIENSLMTYVKQKGKAALARYAQPAGIDPAWRVRATLAFE
ncbi:hypothetical protein [Duganella aceris]|uniref:Sel1 repeat family protein n=1 Tax=Duganella aceris TaxID=2703883 RepID=A0ABX0FII0_9BURK|nr:hypothetical protein [Duganella aceris]NGZ84346.1 hypothetical protein [Duganella aceris]